MCRYCLEERSGVFAEFGEGVEGAAPDDAALLKGDEHGAQEGEDEDQGAEGKEEGVPGGDAGVAAEQTVCVGDRDEGEDGGEASGREEETDGRSDAEGEEPEAAEQARARCRSGRRRRGFWS